MTSGTNKEKNGRDQSFVRQDGVLKEQVVLESNSSNIWHQKWGFLLEFDKLCIEAAEKHGMTAEEYRQLTRQSRAVPFKKEVDFKLQLVEYVPKTSSGFVGWRSKRLENSLEKFGPLYISPKSTLPPDPPASYIFLG